MLRRKKSPSQKQARRRFLATGAGSVAILAFPMISKGQGPIAMRWQSAWSSKDIFHEYALDWAKKVNDMTGGDLKIDVLPAGAIVPAFGLLDGVSKGALDGGHGVLVYHYGKQAALAGRLGEGAANLLQARACLPKVNPTESAPLSRSDTPP